VQLEDFVGLYTLKHVSFLILHHPGGLPDQGVLSLTLLNTSEEQTRLVVKLMRILVNFVPSLNAMLQWVRCWPIETLWDDGAGVTSHSQMPVN